jgi:tetratricopeptide (TPR) repeat protein
VNRRRAEGPFARWLNRASQAGRRTAPAALALAAALVAASGAAAGGADDGNAGLDAFNRGDFRQAVVMFTRALADGDLSADDREFAYAKRGEAYLKLGQSKAAIADLRRATALRPGDTEAADMLKLALSGRTRPTQPSAPRPYGAAEALADANAGAQALANGEFTRAVTLFTRAISSGTLGGDNLELAYVSRAQAALAAGDAHQALADAFQALKLKPDDADARPVLTQALQQLRPPAPVAPVDAATCAANFTSKGNFFKGKTLAIWGVYPSLSANDAFAGIYAYVANPANGPSGPWTIASATLDPDAISATSLVVGTPLQSTLDVRIAPDGAGSRVSITFVVPGLMIASNTREYLCAMLDAAVNG